jgi:flagellar basal body rod protein FlgC
MSLFSVLSIGVSGMAAQRARAELLVENLANAETTHTPEGGPYRRKEMVFESTATRSQFSSVFLEAVNSPGGVAVAEVLTDTRDPERRYAPGHPERGRGRVCGLSAHQPRQGHGGSDGSFAQLSGQRRGHRRGKRHDSSIYRPIPLEVSNVPTYLADHRSNSTREHPASRPACAGGDAFREVFNNAIRTVEAAGSDASASIGRFLSGEGRSFTPPS